MPDTQLKEFRGSIKKWTPKKWRVEYSRIVAMKVKGMSNIEIAKEVNFTPQYVSKILTLPQAVELYDKFQDKIQAEMLISIPQNLNDIAHKTSERLKALIDNDELFAKSPFQVIAAGMKVVEGLGHLRGGGNGALPAGEIPGALSTVNIGVVNITPNQKSELLGGIDKLQQVKSLQLLKDGTNG
jgi:hypothetical protein